MTTIILARHGETDWNREEVFRGIIDVALNGTGIKQAKLLAAYLSSSKVAAIYSSPLGRAAKTAEIIASYHSQARVEIAPDLMDLDYGEWQGLSHQVVRDKYPQLYAEWVRNPHLVKIPGGECLDDVKKRATNLVGDVIARHKGTVVLVSHRVVNKVLICALLGLDNSHFWNMRVDTCGVTTFDYKNRMFILVRHNDTSFLKPILETPLSDF